MKLPTLKCKRCNYEWIPRQEKKPAVCPACKSRIWDKDKVDGKRACADSK